MQSTQTPVVLVIKQVNAQIYKTLKSLKLYLKYIWIF